MYRGHFRSSDIDSAVRVCGTLLVRTGMEEEGGGKGRYYLSGTRGTMKNGNETATFTLNDVVDVFLALNGMRFHKGFYNGFLVVGED
jgi:hypothetical protein